jgi:hypothetical protein
MEDDFAKNRGEEMYETLKESMGEDSINLSV